MHVGPLLTQIAFYIFFNVLLRDVIDVSDTNRLCDATCNHGLFAIWQTHLKKFYNNIKHCKLRIILFKKIKNGSNFSLN